MLDGINRYANAKATEVYLGLVVQCVLALASVVAIGYVFLRLANWTPW